ncbi:MAG TPA: DUF167 domain-containing protein [Vicinamibacterales bacterium]
MTAPAISLVATPGGTRLDVRVVPRSSRTGVDGVRNGRLLLRVTAAPVDRAANEAAVRALADVLHVPVTSVRIRSGHTRRNKTVEIAAPLTDIRRRLDEILSVP